MPLASASLLAADDRNTTGLPTYPHISRAIQWLLQEHPLVQAIALKRPPWCAASSATAGAAERLRAVFAAQVAPAIARVCVDTKSAPTRAGPVATQIMGLAYCRYILQLQPVASLKRADLIEWVAPTIQRYILGPKPA